MDEVGCDADIFDFKPCRAGKKVECSNAGLGKFKRVQHRGSFEKMDPIHGQFNKRIDHG